MPVLTPRDRANQQQAARIARHIPLSPSSSTVVTTNASNTNKTSEISSTSAADDAQAPLALTPEAALRLWGLRVEAVAHSLVDGSSGTLRDADLSHLRGFWDDLA